MNLSELFEDKNQKATDLLVAAKSEDSSAASRMFDDSGLAAWQTLVDRTNKTSKQDNELSFDKKNGLASLTLNLE